MARAKTHPAVQETPLGLDLLQRAKVREANTRVNNKRTRLPNLLLEVLLHNGKNFEDAAQAENVTALCATHNQRRASVRRATNAMKFTCAFATSTTNLGDAVTESTASIVTQIANLRKVETASTNS